MCTVLLESPCLGSGKAGSCPGEERPRQRNVCGDRDGFEQGLWSGQENTGNWLQLKVLLPGDCSRDGKTDKRCCHGGTRQHPIAARYEKPRRMPKTAEDYPGLIKLWAIKKDFMGCWEPKARNRMEMPNLLGRRAKKRIEIAELELDEG